MTELSRPVVRWFGGKWKLAPWIISHFGQHRIYVEPFGGGASVLLRKAPSYAEIYNDLDGDIVNLFRVLRSERAAELVTALELTPFAREEFTGSYEAASDPVERARRLLVKSFMGFGSNAHNSARSTGFRANSNRSGTTPARDWRNYPGALMAAIDRLRGVIVECRDASEVMRQHDGETTLHYVDPPYVWETRAPARTTNKSYAGYVHELSDADHEALIEVLRGLKGAVVLSGYQNEIYDARLTGWLRIDRAAFADGAAARTESIWLNERARACRPHATMFEGVSADGQ